MSWKLLFSCCVVCGMMISENNDISSVQKDVFQVFLGGAWLFESKIVKSLAIKGEMHTVTVYMKFSDIYHKV